MQEFNEQESVSRLDELWMQLDERFELLYKAIEEMEKINERLTFGE